MKQLKTEKQIVLLHCNQEAIILVWCNKASDVEQIFHKT